MPARKRLTEAAAAFFLTLLLAWSVPAAAQTAFSPTATYETCFTPGDDCEGLIVRTIESARRSIDIQAYEFTSRTIAQALHDARKRGVDVRAILDKSQERGKSGVLEILESAAIPLRIDDKVSIAHNKVIVIDGATTITGSFNFTNAAQRRNAENVLIVRNDRGLAQAYEANFGKRWSVSRTRRQD